MQITEHTLYADFRAFEAALTSESVREIKAAAERKYGSPYELTIDEFFGVMSGDFSLLGDATKPTVLQEYWAKRFVEFCDEFAKTCERLTIKDADDERMSAGCVPMTAQERMLTFTREYFGLPSFFEAGKRTIGEYLTARKDRYNAARMQKNFAEDQKRKLKQQR